VGGRIALSGEVEQPVANERSLFNLRHLSVPHSQGPVAVGHLSLGKSDRIALEDWAGFKHWREMSQPAFQGGRD
jgi:hypothetical protein